MRLYLGTYTAGGTFFPGACGGGIMTCTLDSANGTFSGLRCAAAVTNPSWLHLTDGGQCLFSVSERFDRLGEVQAFDVETDGALVHRSTRSSHGLATCHLTTTGNHLYAASYLDGRLSVYPRQGGQIGEAEAVLQYAGTGPNSERQEGAHAHQAMVSPDGRWLYVCDLGADSIRLHSLDGDVPAHVRDIAVEPGAGPRHLVFHSSKPLVWCVCELVPLILTFAWDAATGDLRLIQTLSVANDPELEGVGAAAAIKLHPSEKLLGISDRDTHSITLFSVEESGELTLWQRIKSEDRTPRDFIFLPNGRWLVAAFQDSHALTCHAVAEDLRVSPIPTDRLEVHSPVCISTCMELVV